MHKPYLDAWQLPVQMHYLFAKGFCHCLDFCILHPSQLYGVVLFGFQSGNLLYTTRCSTSFTIPLELLRVEYVRYHEILETKQLLPKISSQISLRLAYSVSSMLIKITCSLSRRRSEIILILYH